MVKKEHSKTKKSFEERAKKFFQLAEEDRKEENIKKFKEWEKKILLKRTIRITI
ncbi:MAG: hypothetical protein J7L26_09570 [Candidatus Aminicenantes bacterium]|nr:hypothetical protein [Candidatus Aminicenantes bacterium]